MNSILAILLAFGVGLCFVISFGITKFVKNKKELTLFAISMAFTVMLGMILFDIIPEIAMVTKNTEAQWLKIIGFTALGMITLKILDFFIPHHDHHHKEKERSKKEHNAHLYHIGFITSISLILHNILEGMSIYITTLSDIKAGLLMALAVSLHNIPMGMEISVNLDSEKNRKKTTIGSLIFLTISSTIGALILFAFKKTLKPALETFLLCMTFGMLIYITLFELLKEMYTYKKEKWIYYGLGVGILLNIIMVFL